MIASTVTIMVSITNATWNGFVTVTSRTTAVVMVTSMTTMSVLILQCFKPSQIPKWHNFVWENSMWGNSEQEMGNLEWETHSRLPLQGRME